MKKSTDHTGRVFRGVGAMCAHWHIDPKTYRERLARGWALERALSEPTVCATPARDHTGRDFPSMTDMAKAWGLPPRTLQRRLDRGWDLERALTAPRGRAPVRDHTGAWFPCRLAMARAWGVPVSTLEKRLRAGWGLERALATPPAPRNPRPPRETPEQALRRLTGGSRQARRAVARSGLPREVIIERLARGWEFGEALNTPAKVRMHGLRHDTRREKK